MQVTGAEATNQVGVGLCRDQRFARRRARLTTDRIRLPGLGVASAEAFPSGHDSFRSLGRVQQRDRSLAEQFGKVPSGHKRRRADVLELDCSTLDPTPERRDADTHQPADFAGRNARRWSSARAGGFLPLLRRRFLADGLGGRRPGFAVRLNSVAPFGSVSFARSQKGHGEADAHVASFGLHHSLSREGTNAPYPTLSRPFKRNKSQHTDHSGIHAITFDRAGLWSRAVVCRGSFFKSVAATNA
jgi:hypothetical protein